MIPKTSKNRKFPSETLEIVVAGQVPPPWGGQNIVVLRMLKLLDGENNFQVRHWRFAFNQTWVSARSASIGKILELFRVLGRLLSLRLRGRVDVIIYPIGGPHAVSIIRDMFLLPAARFLTPRIILHFQAAGITEYLSQLPKPVGKVVRFLYAFCVDEAWVLTSFGRKDPVAIGIGTVHILPNCVDPLPLKPQRAMPSDATVILCVGHLCPDKGTLDLLHAFSKVAREDPTLELRLVGECLPPYSFENLLKDIESSGVKNQIQILGLKTGKDLIQEYTAADLFIFASHAPYESFGLVMVEAMWAALPLVVTNWRGNLEVATAEMGGVIAEIGALDSALKKALQQKDKWNDWGLTNYRIAKERYEPEIFRKRLMGLLCVRDVDC